MSRHEVNTAASSRVPKLQVRNRNPLDQDSVSTSSSGETRESEDPDAITSISPKFQNSLPSPTWNSSRPPLERNLSGSATLDSAASSSPSKTKKSKKKGSSMLGFLTLKEPSQTALEKFAEETRRQAAEKAGSEKSGRTSAVAVPGISTRKLPPTVPKVNSKWDGVPESVKSKEAQRKSLISPSRSKSHSLEGAYGTRLTNLSNGSFNPPNSLSSSYASLAQARRRPVSLSPSVSSTGSQPRDLVLRHAHRNTGVFDPAAAGLKTRTSLKSPSMSSLPEISYFFPNENTDQGAAAQRTPPDTQPKTPKNTSPDTSVKETTQRSESHELVRSISAEDIAWARSPTLVEFNPDPKNLDAHIVLKRISNNFQGFLAGEAQEVVLPDEDEESILEAPSEATSIAPSVSGDDATEVSLEPLLDPEHTTGMEPTAAYMLFANLSEPARASEPITGLEPVQEKPESESPEEPLLKEPLLEEPLLQEPFLKEPVLEEPQSEEAPSEEVKKTVNLGADAPEIPTKNPNRWSLSSTSPTKMSPAKTRTNFSRPLSYQIPLEPKPSSRPLTADGILPNTSFDTPTILEATTTDDAVVNFAALSHNGNHHQRQDSFNDAASIAPSISTSIAPSEMSARWFQSPRERLGLGGRIKKPTDQMPWELGAGERELAERKNMKKRRSLFGKSMA